MLTRLSGDGYPRFKQEVATLEQLLLTDLDVLPIIAVHLPDESTRDDPPWYCMPVATLLRAALANTAPREIARSISGLARTGVPPLSWAGRLPPSVLARFLQERRLAGRVTVIDD